MERVLVQPVLHLAITQGGDWRHHGGAHLLLHLVQHRILSGTLTNSDDDGTFSNSSKSKIAFFLNLRNSLL